MKKAGILLLIAIVIFLASTMFDNSVPFDSSTSNITNVIDANNKFAFDFYKQINNDEENIFYSPYSISTVVAMLYEGAGGQTAEEIKSTFYYPEIDVLRKDSLEIYLDINKQDKPFILDTGNALWVEKTFPIKEDYVSTIENYYGGKAINIDFINEQEKSRMIINDFIEEQTRDKIKDIIPVDSISVDTRLILTNAIYFKGDWDYPFNESLTEDMDFITSEGDVVNVSTMNILRSFRYTDDSEVQVLEIPYEGDELSMLILLPREKNISRFEQSLTVEKLSSLKENLVKQRVNTFLPKFKLETDYGLKEILRNLGVTTVFSTDANLLGIGENLSVSDGIHKAFIVVDEKGTEAAAATAVSVIRESYTPEPEPKIFRADHPFIFIIQDVENGNILFIGRVGNPSQ